jgi:hypothetical protein
MVMLKLLAVLVVLGSGAWNATIGPEFFTTVNTALNLITLIYLQRHSRRVERDIAPKVEHVNEVLGDALPGGARRFDPPECNDDGRQQ